MLTHLVYASRARDGLLLSEVTPIIAPARANNAQRGVTGLLVFDGSFFLQALEGGRDEVNRLFQKLLRDPRHTDVTLLSYGPIVDRAFSNWAMELVTSPEREILWRYSTTQRFDPYELSPASAVELLSKLGHLRATSHTGPRD